MKQKYRLYKFKAELRVNDSDKFGIEKRFDELRECVDKYAEGDDSIYNNDLSDIIQVWSGETEIFVPCKNGKETDDLNLRRGKIKKINTKKGKIGVKVGINDTTGDFISFLDFEIDESDYVEFLEEINEKVELFSYLENPYLKLDKIEKIEK